MTFERAWVLLLLLLPAVWTFLQWRRSSGFRVNLLLKAVSIAAVIVALSEPRMSVPETKVATVVLVDTSAGLSRSDFEHASELVSRIDGARGRNWMRVIPFARRSRVLTDEETKKWAFRQTSGDAGRATDIESAIRDGVASIPGGMVPRIVVISDGNENQGSVARAAYLARQLRIPIDTLPLSGKQQPLLRVESVTMPGIAFAGEKFPIDLVISSPKKAAASVELSAEGRKLGTQTVALSPGTNYVRIHTAINVTGAVEINGVVESPGEGEARFEQALTLRRPRVLYFSNDPPGTEKHLLDTLVAAQFQVDRSQDPVRAELRDYQMVVFNNWDLEALPASRKDEFEKFVKNGGGLLVIGGEQNVYKEDKKAEDAMDRTLPAKLAPPRTPEGTCVVLIVDKSSSMEGRKMELARVAAIGVIENLRPVDQVGVLIFDNSHHWAVPIRRAEDRTTIKRLVSGITPDGGTQIAPALAEAFKRIALSAATYRHVVLLTDGISEEGDSLSVAKDAGGKRITISTVGLGQDVNRAYLEKVATLAKGRSYFLTDPSGLEQILLKDVMEHTGSTAIEKPIRPLITRKSSILDGVGMESAPTLRGYVKFISKPGADTILKVEEDPLLAVWQAGLGRSAVFTSDAKARWAEQWVSWEGFDKFWINLFRDLLPHSQTGETRVAYDNASGNLVIDYKLAGHVAAPAKAPDIYVLGPDEFRQPIAIRKVSDRAWRGEAHIGSRTGLFRVRPLEESLLFPETGLYRDDQEMTQFGANEALLRRVSDYSGGRYQPQPAQVFDAAGRSIYGMMQLWPGLLALAVLLNIIELIIRKWDGIMQTFKARRPAMAG